MILFAKMRLPRSDEKSGTRNDDGSTSLHKVILSIKFSIDEVQN